MKNENHAKNAQKCPISDDFGLRGAPSIITGKPFSDEKRYTSIVACVGGGGGLPYVEQLDHFFSRVSSLWELKTCMSFLTPPRKKKKKQIQEKNIKRYRVKETHSWRTINRYTARIMPHKKKSLGF